MKKTFLLIFLFIPILLSAQYNYMALNFGLSKPLGNYAASNNLSSNGFAYTGMTGDCSGVYYLKKWFGIAGDIKYTSNTINDQKVKNLLNEEIPVLSPNSDTTITYSIGYWKHVSFLVGPQFTLSKGIFSADFYATGGLSIVMNPSININLIIGTESFTYSTSPQYARFGFDIGTSLRFRINDKFGIRFFGSYFQTSGKGNIENELPLASRQVDFKSYASLVQTLNFGIGIIYVLNNNEAVNNDLEPY